MEVRLLSPAPVLSSRTRTLVRVTHPHSEVVAALQLHDEGLTAVEISRRLGVPRPTIADWVIGKTPQRRHGGCDTCCNEDHRFNELGPTYVYLLGLYLGDGYIAKHRRNVYRLRIFLDDKYPLIIEAAAGAMGEVAPHNKVGRLQRKGHSELSAYSKSWPCLFPQHGLGKKHTRSIVLSDWQKRVVAEEPWSLLRGLIHSDGCRFINRGRGWSYPRYGFDNLSADIRKIFSDTCDQLSLHWTSAPRRIYVSRKADVARMDEMIGPKA